MTRLVSFMVLVVILPMPFACTTSKKTIRILGVRTRQTQSLKATHIISDTPGARIEINNVYIGNTPLWVEIGPGRGKLAGQRVHIRVSSQTENYYITCTIEHNGSIPEEIDLDAGLRQIREYTKKEQGEK
ncbi:MAG: PEGA domain-containing protein [Candidatus Thiodiazotropha sp. (ex Rostrolucina anterorostrata)]|nr:PEGA domain-containing protein [Candidatus Thiodiazotropha sp. (ex Rostrolucina anterorostrata)]